MLQKKLAHDMQAHRSSPLIPFFFLLTKNSLNTPHLTLSLNQDFFLPLYAPWYLQFTFLFQKNDVISNDPFPPLQTQYRTERDTFGELQVPADRYWGAQTQR